MINGFGLSDDMGGSAVRSVEVAKRLLTQGHTIFFVTTHGGLKALRREKLKAKYYVLPSSIWTKRERGLFDRFLAYVISTLAFPLMLPRLPKADVIYTDSDYFCDTVPAVLYKQKFKTAKWVAMTHHLISISTSTLRDLVFTIPSVAIQKFGYYLFRKCADAIFVLGTESGKAIKNYLVSSGISPLKIHYVLNGVDIKLTESIKNGEKKYDACFLGGLRPSKGLHDVVPVWKKVCSCKKDATLLIIGSISSHYLGTLQDEIRKSGLTKNIIILGFVANSKEKLSYLKLSRVFFFPSHAEGFGIAILEAMACGLPVVAWDLPLYESLFPKGMIRVPTEDIEKCANAIKDLLTNSAQYDTISNDALEVASRYDWDKVAKREILLIEGLQK